MNGLMELGFEDRRNFGPIGFLKIRIRIRLHNFGDWLSSKFDTLSRMKEWRHIFSPFNRFHPKNVSIYLFSSGQLGNLNASRMPRNNRIKLIHMVGKDKVTVGNFFKLCHTFDFPHPRTKLLCLLPCCIHFFGY